MRNAKKVILEVSQEFEKLTGRKYSFFEEYKNPGTPLKVKEHLYAQLFYEP